MKKTTPWMNLKDDDDKEKEEEDEASNPNGVDDRASLYDSKTGSEKGRFK